ncbi:MAG: CHASE2 domain-containing protein [Candidatus Omnitrophica bacterium]|nr:CHASE2 domain-containing protein [Candidatus Omnitrophota bacterium]
MLKQNDKIIRYAAVCLCAAVVLLCGYFRVFETFELQTLDLRFKARPLQKTNPDIVVIEIAEDTLEAIGRWPFDRIYHGYLIEALREAGAKQIVFDVVFSEESKSDSLLLEVVKQGKEIYLPYVFCLNRKKKGEITAEYLQDPIISGLKEASASHGHINFVPDIDGKNRKIPLYVKSDGQYYPHLAFSAALDYLNIKKEDIVFKPGRYVKLGNLVKIPLNERNELIVNYAGTWEKTFKHYSFADVIKSYALSAKNEDGEVPPICLSDFKGKTCFVALTAAGLHDLQPVPLAERYPGIGVHLNVFNSIVSGKFLVRAGRLTNLFILILWAGAVLLLSRTTIYRGLVYNGIAILFFITASFGLFIFCGVWIDIFYPVLVGIFLYLALILYHLIVEKHRSELLEKELSVARRIQESFLPQEPLKKEGFEVASSMDAARQVGGDLYQFVDLGNNKFAIMIADVSGKGIPAALFMVRIVTEFRSWAKQFTEPQKVLSRLNEELAAGARTGLFVTVSYSIIDDLSKKVRLADGGHLPLMLYEKKTDTVKEERPAKGMPLGLMPGVEFDEKDFTLSGGDVLVYYTDGVTEARSVKSEEFGFELLKEIIKREHNKSAQGILNAIKDEIRRFSAKAPQHDDITIIVLKVI